MDVSLRTFSDFIYVSIAVGLQWKLASWLVESDLLSNSRSGRGIVWAAFTTSAILLFISGSYGVSIGLQFAPTLGWGEWLRGGIVLWGVATAGVFVVALIFRQSPSFDPKRRKLLAAGRGVALALPVAVAGGGVVLGRTAFHIRETEVQIPGLAAELDGLRIVHLSDLHLGPFLSKQDLQRVVAMANETRPHLTAVTGDLITMRGDMLPECLNVLKDLKADAGVYGCLGNHEVAARCQDAATGQGKRLGIHFLRSEARRLRFGNATLNLGGVDWQRQVRSYLKDAGQHILPGAANILLSHNPDVFPVAAQQGWDLTLAGHTHGGQVTVSGLQRYLNVARFFTPYVHGLYRKEKSSIYVTSGIGTVGVPARIGAPPEIALITLRRGKEDRFALSDHQRYTR